MAIKLSVSILSGVLSVSAVAQQSSGPSPVSNAAMAWDGDTGEIVLYGGMGNRGVHADSTLWSWNGQRWQSLGDGAPGARSGAILAHDSRRHRLVLVGGQNAASAFGDTWEWDGERWIRQSENGPGPRHMTNGAYDPLRGELVLFGGYHLQEKRLLADTWTWNGSRWQAVTGDGPSARAGHAMGFDPESGSIILIGGTDAEGRPHGDSWSWNGHAWTRLGAGPAIIPNSQLAAVPGGGMATFGGWDGAHAVAALFRWQHAAWSRLGIEGGPEARMEASIGYDAARQKLVLFGGSRENGTKLADVWEFDGTGWVDRTPR